MDLSHEHKKIYGRNYQSGSEIKDYLAKKRKKLVDIKSKVQNIQSHHWDYLDNHKLADDVKEEIEVIINRLTKEIEYIDNFKSTVRD